jgi:hypothetical protein
MWNTMKVAHIVLHDENLNDSKVNAGQYNPESVTRILIQ